MKHELWTYEDTHDGACWAYCNENGCPENHPTGLFQIDGPEWDPEGCEAYRVGTTKNKVHACLLALSPEMYAKLEELYEWLDDIGDGAPDASPTAKRALTEAGEIKRLLERAK